MKVLIIGGGVVGVATAYYLSKAGLSVEVLESRERGGLETSAGNAGLISPSDAFSWASPAALTMAARSLINPDLGIQYRSRLDPSFWRWSMSFLMQCRQSKWLHNTKTKYGLADYSLQLLNKLRKDTRIDFDASDNGIIYACREIQSLRELRQHFSVLEDQGLKLEILCRDALIEKVPALNASAGIYAGAVYSPTCKTGDSLKFTQALARWCIENGDCQFKWGTSVDYISMDKNKISGVWTSKGEFNADAYVLAAGPQSGLIAKQIGVKLPIYPIKGFSITAPIINESLAPDIGFDDTQRLVAMSRLGNNLRISSSAVFDGFNKRHSPRDFRSILKIAKEVFPNAADYDKAEYWAGLRPMTPRSVPILGRSPVKNLLLNVGHGHLGWTMSCGAGKVIADIVTGESPKIDIASFCHN